MGQLLTDYTVDRPEGVTAPGLFAKLMAMKENRLHWIIMENKGQVRLNRRLGRRAVLSAQL